MIYLGISQDRYDSGVALADGTRVLYAANEERFTRRKNQGGFPFRALESAFRYTGLRPEDVGLVCFAGIMTPPLPGRMFPSFQNWLFHDDLPATPGLRNWLLDVLLFRTPFAHGSGRSAWRQMAEALLPFAARRPLNPKLRQVPARFIEHHLAHASAACCLSGMNRALCVTADGMGDGLSMTVNDWKEGELKRLWSASSRHSFGLFYEMMTEAFGFIPNRHEGKLTGLAAYGDARKVDLPSPFAYEADRLAYRGPHGRKGVHWARQTLLRRYQREDVAAWAQSIVERHVVEIVRVWVERTGLRKLTVAGGVFANVKLNQKLHELAGIEEMFVCPHMGDGGQSVGALCAAGAVAPHTLRTVFWGESFDEKHTEAALRNSGLHFQKVANVEVEVAKLIARGKIVARFRDRMEWGPRALGNRSVLAPTASSEVAERLNRLLRRSEFMPFAPAVLDEDADRYFFALDRARHAAGFMTVCFAATERMRADHPAVVHVDGTVRPQIVRADANPALHRLLCAYKAQSGYGMLLNTSFNIHEEPIVRTPEEAVRAFRAASLDCLAMGDYLAFNPRQTAA